MSDDIRLAGGWHTDVRRVGDVVVRAPKPQSQTVVALLRHLHESGFDGSPRPVDGGFTTDGWEQVEFVEGDSPHPGPWTEEEAWRLGDLVRRLHEATAGFVPPAGSRWQPWFARALAATHIVVGHGDLGPWNVIRRPDERLVLIDWDNAGPIGVVWEVAQLVWLNAHLHDDDVAAQAGLPAPAERMRHVGAIVDGYRLAPADRECLCDCLIEFAVRSARDEAIQASVTAESTSPDARGFPTLWAVAWRARAAAWMIDHRSLIHAAATM